MNLEFHLRIVGASLLLLAGAHLFFPQRFDWKNDLQKLTLLNRQIFYVHCFFIVLVLVLFGALTLFRSRLLLQPGELNQIVLAGFCLFWLARLFVQFFVYDPRLWRGHPFHTKMHILFSLLWAYYTSVYGVAFWQQCHSQT